MSKTVPTTQPVVNIKRAAYAMATDRKSVV